MAAGSTYTPIATTTASGSANAITFSNISTSYTDLVIVCKASYSSTSRTTFSVNVGNGSVDTGANYGWIGLYGNGSSVGVGKVQDQTYLYGGVISQVPCVFTVNINNYANTSIYKNLLLRGNSLGATASEDIWLGSGLWKSTSAINYIKFSTGDGTNFTSDSMFTIYGITAA